MKAGCVAVLGTAFAVCLPGRSPAADDLTLERALELARQRSPAILAARARAAEAEARLRARPALRENPALEGALGRRPRDRAAIAQNEERPNSLRGFQTDAPADFEIQLSQRFELGGRGGARRAMEEAALAREGADAAAAERTVLREVRSAFLRGRHAAERLSLITAAEAEAAELQRIARRRHDSGDIAILDVNIASSALARVRAEVKGVEAAQATAHADLRGLLDIPAGEPLSLIGELREERSYDAARLLAAIDERPEIRALEAQLREVEAEVRLGKGLAWPEITPSVRYEQDEGHRIWWAGLSITLPVFDRGRQILDTGRARAERLRAETESRRRLLQNQLQTALTLYDLRLAAARELTANAGTLSENEGLARRSYEVGQIGLSELLLLRRETAEARREWLDSLLELAHARAELDSLAGGSR